MKNKLMSLSIKKNLIILLSIISFFLSKAFYYEVLQTSVSIESELEKIFITLLASAIYLVIDKSILKLTNKKFLISLFLCKYLVSGLILFTPFLLYNCS